MIVSPVTGVRSFVFTIMVLAVMVTVSEAAEKKPARERAKAEPESPDPFPLRPRLDRFFPLSETFPVPRHGYGSRQAHAPNSV